MEYYSYRTTDPTSYKKLVEELANNCIPFAVVLCQDCRFEVIAKLLDEHAKGVGSFIDDNALNFHISPVEREECPFEALPLIKQLRLSLEENIAKNRKLENDCERYFEKAIKQKELTDRVKEQVRAISVLIDSIFPKEKN